MFSGDRSILKSKSALTLNVSRKSGVHGRQGAIEMRLANHDHFSVGWDRLGSEALRWDPTEKRRRLFDSQLAVLNHSLQGFPDACVSQNVATVNH